MKPLTIFLAICALCAANITLASNDALAQAIGSFNARAQTDAGKKLALNAVSQQTNVPEKTLQAHMAATHLNYGALLTAESLAAASGKTVNAIVAMKQGKGWADVSKEVKIDPGSIVSRLQSAEKLVQGGMANKNRAGNTKKPGTSTQSAAPDVGKATGY